MHKLGLRIVSLVTFFVFPLVGCSGAPDRAEEGTGTLSASLVATGSDGASYRFPSGTFMVICPVPGGDCGDVPLDGPELQVSRTLPPGSYRLIEFRPKNPPDQLVRTLNGTTGTVSAKLLNSQPIAFTIVKDQTTVLTLRFEANSVTDVTFAAGKLLLTVSVTQKEVGTGSSITGQGTLNVESVRFDVSANAEARELLAASPGDMVPYSITYQTTGGWTLQGDGSATVPIRASFVIIRRPCRTDLYSVSS
jgi:hypothetical protein